MSQFISDLGFLNQNQIARFLLKKTSTKLTMAAKGLFNIFSKNYDQPDKHSAVELFSTICQTNQNQNQRPFIKETISKRQNFGNEIRQKQKQKVKRNIREQLVKVLQQNDFLNLLESFAAKNSVQSKNFSNFLSDLKRNVNDYGFCMKLDQSNNVKQFLLDYYTSNRQQLPLKQKTLLVHSLTILTYFGNNIFQGSQKQQLNQMMILQLERMQFWNCETIEYFTKLLDLLTNITADHDQNLNYYLMDTNIFPLISEKITHLSQAAQKFLNQHRDQEMHINYMEDLSDIRSSLISTLYNLSDYDNEFFFRYTVNEFVNDRNYLELSGARVMNIFSNFFQHPKFRQHFIENSDLVIWFETEVTTTCQKRFLNSESIKTGKFQDVVMENGEKQLFYQLLCCLINWLNSERDEAYLKMMEIIIQGNLNSYCLSEFLIQSAGQIGSQNRTKRNSIYVAKAIQMYEYLASDPSISLSELLIVTSERTFEDILKVFLDETYFTSCKISDLTISVLNKMLSKDHRILNTLMELRILQSIDSFLSKDMKIQTVQQILNFFDLLTLMIASNDEYPKKKHNQIARLLEIQGLVTKIQRYQNHQEKKVGDKIEAFLNFFDTVREGNTKYELLEI